MKKIYLSLLAASFCITFVHAQTLYNNGGTIFINNNGKVHVRGNLTNETGATLTNNGTLEVTGNSTNNGSLSTSSASAILYQGTTPLIIAGSQPVVGQNVTINNAAGVTLNTPLQVTGTLTLTNGIIDATTQPVILNSTASVSGTSDASHVKGTVIKEGLGSFVYPVGDGNKYQKVEFNATANATGIKVSYNAGNAGNGNYTSAGSDAILLEKHNTNEYWDITPTSTATGTVTLFWDGYADNDATLLASRRVAHLKNGDWVNEGGSATGSLSAGSITSNTISSFSPFAFGAVPTTMPVRLGSFSAKADGNRAKLEWNTLSEINNSHFIIKRSDNMVDVVEVATVKGNYNAMSSYKAYDYQPVKGINYYHLIQVDANGTATELDVKPLSFSLAGLNLSAHPNPSTNTFNINSSLSGEASIFSVTGKVMKRLHLINGISRVDATNWPMGIYFLKTANGSLKLIKE